MFPRKLSRTAAQHALASSTCPVVDALEQRQLMSVGEPTVSPFNVGVNFLPAGAPAFESYVIDTGATFANRGNAFSYGWNASNNNGRDRNSWRSPDQRYDAFNHMQAYGNRSWEIAVPNGTYQVNLAAGDAEYFNSVYKIDVEGVRVIDGTPTSAQRWIENDATITVTDGRLTVTNGSGAVNNKINFIEITQVSGGGGTTTPTVSVTANDASAAEAASSNGQYTITRTGSTAQALEVFYTLGGSASNGSDYQTLDGSVIIPAGQSSVTVTVDPIDDASVEGNETVVLTLTDGAVYNLAGPSAATVTIADNDASQPPPASQPGLTGEYFDNQDLTGPKFTRVDSTVNFAWGTGAPAASMGPDTFSVRWTGFVQPQYTENYRFYVDANNGVRLWVNNQLIIDRWTNAYGETSGTVNLQAGQKYAIRLEYFDFDNNANVKLSWSSASRAKQVIPQSALSTGTDDQEPPPPGNQAPSVGIASPGSGSSFNAGSTITIVANASDSDGTVTKVEFFANGTKIGEDLGGDFDTDWFNVSAGTYTITAIATDDDGAKKTSAPITLTVNGGSTSTTINWATRANSPITRFEAPSVVIDGKVWVFGGWYWDNATQLLRGSKRIDVYNPDTNTWSRKADLPTELTHQGVVVDGNFIYMIGGFVGPDPGVATNDVWRYSISGNSWTKMTWELPDNLAAGAAVLIGRELHWIGGSEDDRVTDTGEHWVMNIDNPSAGWTAKAALPNARHHFSHAVVNGKIYVFGGQHEHDTEERAQDNTAHVYNPSTNQWTALKNMPRAVSHAEPGTFVMNGKIYIAGGMTTGRVSLKTITEYDPATNTYRELTPLPQAVTAPVVQYVNGKIFFTAGTTDAGGAQNKSWLGTFA